MNPIKLYGNWTEGYALDNHVLQSVYIGDDPFGNPRFDTTRSVLGELLYKMKYNGHHNTTKDIMEIITPFLNEWLSDKQIDSVIPVPPSHLRYLQPVFLLAEAIADKYNTYYVEDVLIKTSSEEAKNMPKNNKHLDGTISKQKKANRNCNVLLVDDLFSTGSTVTECVNILQTDPMIKNIYYLAITKTR